jgi:transglutaminase-like putative cysteine protease
MRTSLLFILVISMLLSAGLSAQSYRSEFQIGAVDPELLKAEVVVLNEERKLIFDEDGQVTLSVRQAVLLQRENESLQSVEIYYDPDSKLNSFSLSTYDADGERVRTYSKDDLNDQLASFQSDISNNRVYWLDVATDTYPFTMEMQYEIRMEGFFKVSAMHWNILPGFSASLQKAHFLIEYPESFEIDVLARNIEVEVEERSTKKGRFKSIHLEQIDAYRYEELGATPADVLPSIWVFPHKVRFENFSGSFADWNSYGQFITQLYSAAGSAPEALQREIQDRVRNTTTDLERIEILYRFMQEEMRYVSIQLGLGGWKPLPVSFVYERKYGDCKALSTYMRAMLAEVGIQSYPVLIYRGDVAASQLDSNYPTYLFNHVILYVPSEDMFLECTSSHYPPGFLGLDNLSRRALLVTETGGELIEMPRSEESENRLERQVQLSLEASGSATIHLEENTYGGLHQYPRQIHAHYQSEDQLEWLTSYLDLPAHEMNSWSLVPDPDQTKAEVEMDFVIHRYGSKMGRRLFMPMQVSSILPDVPTAYPDRAGTLILRNGYQKTEMLTIELPDGYEIETIPAADHTIESPFGTFTVEIETTESEIRITQYLQRLDGEWPADQYEAYRQFLLEAHQLVKDQIVLVQARP